MMKRITFRRLVLLLAFLSFAAVPARGQVSYEEAMRRLRERMAARAHAGQTATTAPATRVSPPATEPSAKAPTLPATAKAKSTDLPEPTRCGAFSPPVHRVSDAPRRPVSSFAPRFVATARV